MQTLKTKTPHKPAKARAMRQSSGIPVTPPLQGVAMGKAARSGGDREPEMNAAPRTRRPTLSRGDLDTTPLLGASVVEFQRMVQFDILRGLNVNKCVRWMEEARMGFLCHPLRAWEALAIRDDVIPTVKWKREDAVAQRPWSLLQSAEVKTDASLQKEADDQKRLLGYFWNNIRVVDAWDRNQRGLFSAFVRMALHIQSMRYGAIHFVWRPGAKGLTAMLEFVPGWMFENFTGVLRYIGPDPSIMYGTPIEDDPNWLIIGGKGLMEPGSLGATIKAGGLDTWIKYCRRYGLPFPLGKTNASPGDKQWREMERAVRGINNDNGAVIGTGATIELLKAEGTGDTPSSLLVERIDRAFSSMWRGGDLGTMSSKSGQGTGSDQQSGESDLIEAADCTWLSEIMQEIDRRVLAYWQGEDVEVLSYSNVRGPNLVDAQAELGVDTFAIQNGFKLSKKEWGERNNRSEASDDDDVLVPVTGVTPASVPSVAAQLNSSRRRNAPMATNAAGMPPRFTGSLTGLVAANQAEPNKDPAPVPAQLTDAVHQDMQPFCKAVAKLLPDPAQATAIDWKAVARSVLNGGSSTAVLLGELAKAGLGGFGITEAQINDILSHV